jgi:cytochrome P450
MVDAAGMSPAVAKPAHVPDSLVYDFDMFVDPAYLVNPHDRVADLVETAPPVFWTPRRGGHWLLLSHEAVFKASRDWDSFSNEQMSRTQAKAMRANLPPDLPYIPQPVPITVDPPEHTKYRAPLQNAFSPKAVAALEPEIRALAARLIDKVTGRGSCEFMAEIAEPLPVQVFLKMMGLPLERQQEYRRIVREHLASIVPDVMTTIRMMQKVAATVRDTILERRDDPRDDLVSLLWQSKIDGRSTTLEDMENYAVLLFIAGLDTVMNGMGFGIRHIAHDTGLQAQLRETPALIPEAVEELLRRYTFTVPVRRVAKDLVFEGVQMKEGDRVFLFLPAADLDPEEFPDPSRFDLGREGKPHIAFNVGPHRCLGSHLARVELKIVYEEMLGRLPPFRLDPDHPPSFHGGHVVGADSLHIVWDA